MTGSDVPCTSFPGVMLQFSSSDKTVECKEKLEFSSYVHKTAFLLTIINFQYTSKVCTDDTVEQTAVLTCKTWSFFLHS